MVPPFLPSYKNTARSLVWAVSLRKIGSPLLIFIMFPLYTVASRERKVFAKENIEQKGLRTILNKRNTIFLTASCAAQMAVFCVNQGQVSEQAYMFKYITAIISGIFMVILLANIWFSTGKASRNKLYARIFMFVLSFEIILILSSRYLGGLISFVICVVFLVSLIKVHDPRNEKT